MEQILLIHLASGAQYSILYARLIVHRDMSSIGTHIYARVSFCLKLNILYIGCPDNCLSCDQGVCNLC
jgi:hypothetical protein